MMNTHVKCGCLKGSVGLVDTQIRGAASIATPLLKGFAGLVDTQIEGLVGIATPLLNGFAAIVDTQIRGTVGIICTPNTGVYLRITPTTIWLLEDIDTADVDVITNIEWIVK